MTCNHDPMRVPAKREKNGRQVRGIGVLYQRFSFVFLPFFEGGKRILGEKREQKKTVGLSGFLGQPDSVERKHEEEEKDEEVREG